MDKQTKKDLINSIRVLSAEQVQAAKSGHPGTPLGAAPVMAELFGNHMKINPNDPAFFDRDRFVLSAGHTSAMLYATLHCCGYDLTKEDLAAFRQLHSRTPGHPETGVTPGVDAGTGPLGQGLAMAVGMAMAESVIAAQFNKPDCKIVGHYTYAFCGDGCMMEGIENEAASLAGTLKLGKLIVFYDSNRITIEGDTSLAFTEDVAARHKALGWQVIDAGNAEDTDSISRAIAAAKAEKDKPSLIVVHSIIGFGSPKAGSHEVHGAPLGDDGVAALKKTLGWDNAPFTVPASVEKFAARMKEKGDVLEQDYNAQLKTYANKYPADYAAFTDWIGNTSAKAAAESGQLWNAGSESVATRNACGDLLAVIDKLVPNYAGGSADLAPSNCTDIKGKSYYSAANRAGRAFHFGVREHAMGAIVNGIALHGGLLPFCATFFVFYDYMKYAVRMSALMKLPITYIFSHDSIGVGEDGPTHQPVEQLAALRSTPGVYTFRPCDRLETAAAFSKALEGKGPVAIITSRQKLMGHGLSEKDGALKGGYVLADDGKTPDVILMSSGSEVGLCLTARDMLARDGISASVVSMPCMELFAGQSDKYKESVLPKSVRARVAVEAASRKPWGEFVGLDGAYVCLDRFGDSAPADKLFALYGITAEKICEKAKKALHE